MFLVNGIFFHNKNHPQPLKNDETIGDTFEVGFQIQMIWHKLLWETKGKLEMPIEKTKSFIVLKC